MGGGGGHHFKQESVQPVLVATLLYSCNLNLAQARAVLLPTVFSTTINLVHRFNKERKQISCGSANCSYVTHMWLLRPCSRPKAICTVAT